MRLLERDLARSSPQTKLSVVPAYISLMRSLGELGLAHFFSFAVGPCTGGGRSAILPIFYSMLRGVDGDVDVFVVQRVPDSAVGGKASSQAPRAQSR